jgi:tetrahydrodipicolinate N-acetyltransferase
MPQGSVSGDGTLDVGPRWSGGVFLPTTFVVQAGGSCTVNGGFRLMTGSSVIVEPGAHLGGRAMVLKGVTIGDGAVVAAASVVTKDVAPGTLVAGSPARYVRDVTWTP